MEIKETLEKLNPFKKGQAAKAVDTEKKQQEKTKELIDNEGEDPRSGKDAGELGKTWDEHFKKQ